MEENEFILESACNLKRWEETPLHMADDYADMNRDELIKLIIYQRERIEGVEASHKKEREDSAGRISALTEEVSELVRKVGELTEMLKANNRNASETAKQMSGLLKLLNEKNRQIAELQNAVKAGRKNLFGNK